MINSQDFNTKYTEGTPDGVNIIHKSGINGGVTTTYTAISDDGIYRTPSILTSLELVSDNVNDNNSGSGGRKVKVIGLGADWLEVEEIVTLNGTTPVALANQFYRIYRMYVVESGTYASISQYSHVGILTLQESGAGQEWAKINIDGVPLAQTGIGVYTIAAGDKAFIRHAHLQVDSNKAVDFILFIRDNCDDVSSPYSGVFRVIGHYHGVVGDLKIQPSSPMGPFIGPCDIGFLGRVASGSGSAFADFEILVEPI